MWDNQQLICDPGLVMQVPFYARDGGSFMSCDAYGHLCAVSGALWQANGRYFDGVDDYAGLLANRPSLNVAAMTIEVWLKLVTANDNYDSAIGTDTDVFGLDFPGEASSQPRFFADCVAGFVSATAPQPLNHRDFYHIVGTYEAGSGAALYLNRALVSSSSPKGAIKPFTESLTFGGKNGSLYNLNALIGEARIYSRALTPLEIQRNYMETRWRYR